MKKGSGLILGLIFLLIFSFGVFNFLECNAWARAGGGGSSGSRGGRSFSAPSMPSRPSPSSPGMGTPGPSPMPGSPPTSGFGRSPFWQGLAGGVAGGFLGNMLFGGRGYAGGGAYGGGGGVGFLDIILIGAGLYFLMKYLKRRREQSAATGPFGDSARMDGGGESPGPYYGDSQQQYAPQFGEVERGFQELKRYDPSFNEENFKETVQDIFFRIQAGWMNRSHDGVENLLTPQMAAFFDSEFERMKKEGRINRLENIAIRKVEPSEVWQETGKDYVTVLFTANLLDYTVDDKTGQVVQGDKLNPVKFQEFWTFCRDIGSQSWQLTAINQMDEPIPRLN